MDESYFPEEEIEFAKSIMKEFHGRMLLDSTINNPSALLLSIYMICNKIKQPTTEKIAVKELFISLGRKSEEFDKALYEISGKRKGKTKLIEINKEIISLNFNGLEKVKKILLGNKNG
jgi:hypothetical protein